MLIVNSRNTEAGGKPRAIRRMRVRDAGEAEFLRICRIDPALVVEALKELHLVREGSTMEDAERRIVAWERARA